MFPNDTLKRLADEFLAAKNPPFAEAHPTECRELLRDFVDYVSGSLLAPRGPEDDPPAARGPEDAAAISALAGDHPHRVESHTLEDLDEEFRRR